ncbi:hypothetical protein CCHR01_15688 [Colletotrichum chrysophilum]|uniref:Uncharacterized protein n=1 Tax=Colletotrichum chrysophilum TaxID=1836956 RepID=A0AAD9A5V5_9PEZI|nr:hypothetical protein CCHR01_15688 [Colletotrichum chrysophilum]
MNPQQFQQQTFRVLHAVQESDKAFDADRWASDVDCIVFRPGSGRQSTEPHSQALKTNCYGEQRRAGHARQEQRAAARDMRQYGVCPEVPGVPVRPNRGFSRSALPGLGLLLSPMSDAKTGFVTTNGIGFRL